MKPHPPKTNRRTPNWLLASLLLAILIAIVHGQSLTYGLVLDDFNHRAELRESGWSYQGLVDASHLGDPRRRVGMWWQDEADLYFYRPLAFLLMRAEYLLVDWSPVGMHAFSLLWMLAAALLIHRLAILSTGRETWALVAAAAFIVHPANALTARWIACQNEQMATVFILATILLYGRFSRWRWSQAEPPPSRRWADLIGAFVCAVAALGCRETAVILLVLLPAGDWLLRPERLSGRWAVYVTLTLLLVAYFALRHQALGPLEMPARPYAFPPSEPGFVRYVFDKFAYYVLGLFAFIPIIGFEGLRVLRNQPQLFYGLLAAISLAWMVLLLVLRQRSQIGWWLILLVLPLLPVLPVFASAHHLYLASAGAVLALTVTAAALTSPAGTRSNLLRRIARPLVQILVVVLLLIGTGMTLVAGSGMRGLALAGRLPIRDVIERGRPIRAGDHLFFINLPMLGFNCIPAIEERTGARPIHGHALTFAPSLLTMPVASEVEQVADNCLRLTLDDPGWFSGITGQNMLEAIGREAPFQQGERFSTEQYEVEITRADNSAVYELIVTFAEPLRHPRYHFFLASPEFSAYPLQFSAHRDP